VVATDTAELAVLAVSRVVKHVGPAEYEADAVVSAQTRDHLVLTFWPV
jgi:hypothetical protein